MTRDNISSNDPEGDCLHWGGRLDFLHQLASAKDALGSTVDSLSSGNAQSWKVTPGSDADDDAKDSLGSDPNAADSGDAHIRKSRLSTTMMPNRAPTVITVEDSGNDATSQIVMHHRGWRRQHDFEVTCDPEMIPTASGLTDCVGHRDR